MKKLSDLDLGSVLVGKWVNWMNARTAPGEVLIPSGDFADALTNNLPADAEKEYWKLLKNPNNERRSNPVSSHGDYGRWAADFANVVENHLKFAQNVFYDLSLLHKKAYLLEKDLAAWPIPATVRMELMASLKNPLTNPDSLNAKPIVSTLSAEDRPRTPASFRNMAAAASDDTRGEYTKLQVIQARDAFGGLYNLGFVDPNSAPPEAQKTNRERGWTHPIKFWNGRVVRAANNETYIEPEAVVYAESSHQHLGQWVESIRDLEKWITMFRPKGDKKRTYLLPGFDYQKFFDVSEKMYIEQQGGEICYFPMLRMLTRTLLGSENDAAPAQNSTDSAIGAVNWDDVRTVIGKWFGHWDNYPEAKTWQELWPEEKITHETNYGWSRRNGCVVCLYVLLGFVIYWGGDEHHEEVRRVY